MFNNLLSYVFKAFQVLFWVGRALTKKDMIDRNTALECYCDPLATVATAPTPAPPKSA